MDNRLPKILDLSHDLFYLCHDIKLNFALTCTFEGQAQYSFLPLTDIFTDFAHMFAKCAIKTGLVNPGFLKPKLVTSKRVL